jgi:hypothetical protein
MFTIIPQRKEHLQNIKDEKDGGSFVTMEGIHYS